MRNRQGNTSSKSAAAARAAVSGRTKFLWGLSDLGVEALHQTRSAWLVYFYAPPASASHHGWLPLATVSLLLFLGKLIEAFADTLIGYWSDRTTSRLGRRLPFVMLATPPAALFAALLFFPPAGSSGKFVAGWLFIILELFYLCDSLAGVGCASTL